MIVIADVWDALVGMGIEPTSWPRSDRTLAMTTDAANFSCQPEESFETHGWSTPTLTDEQLKGIISKAQGRGFHVFLKPIVTSFGNGPDRPWGCHFKPDSWDRWFSEYTKFAVHFAKLANETGAELYAVGTELDLSSIEELSGAPADATARWKAIITEVRKHYDGNLTLSVSCSIDPERWQEFPCHAPGRIKFWDALDYIGIEPCFPITDETNPSLDELREGLGGKLDSSSFTRAKEFQERYGKPVIVTEYSLRSYEGANPFQLSTPPNPVVDLQEQADMQEAFMRSIEERPWIAGAYHWAWYLVKPDDDMTWQRTDINTFIGKPGGQVLKKWYSKIEDRTSRPVTWLHFGLEMGPDRRPQTQPSNAVEAPRSSEAVDCPAGENRYHRPRLSQFMLGNR